MIQSSFGKSNQRSGRGLLVFFIKGNFDNNQSFRGGTKYNSTTLSLRTVILLFLNYDMRTTFTVIKVTEATRNASSEKKKKWISHYGVYGNSVTIAINWGFKTKVSSIHKLICVATAASYLPWIKTTEIIIFTAMLHKVNKVDHRSKHRVNGLSRFQTIPSAIVSMSSSKLHEERIVVLRPA